MIRIIVGSCLILTSVAASDSASFSAQKSAPKDQRLPEDLKSGQNPEPEHFPEQSDDELASTSRILNGENAIWHQYTWMAQLINKTARTLECSGTLIHERFVLTAAHCVNYFNSNIQMPAEDFSVLVGGFQRVVNHCPSNENCRLREELDVLNFISHDSYNHSSDENDIALIELKTAVSIIFGVSIVSLPTGDMLNTDYSNRIMTVAGYGANRIYPSGTITYPEFLQKMRTQVLHPSVCDHNLPGSVWRTGSATQICALSQGQALARGDSGGPLIYRDSERGRGGYYQMGIVSHGYPVRFRDRREQFQCGVYTKLAYRPYLDWIERTTRSN